MEQSEQQDIPHDEKEQSEQQDIPHDEKEDG